MNTDPVRGSARSSLAGLSGTPGVAKPHPILVASQVRKTFGGLVGVDADHVEIEKAAITALIGPNGAGKTTFFNVLTGFEQPDRGEWLVDGVRLHGLKAHKIAAHGVIRTFQLPRCLDRLSVRQNMMVAAPGQSGESLRRALFSPLWRSQEREIRKHADQLLEEFRLMNMAEVFAGELSGGQRKLLEMARALMARPVLLMLDEPMAGVNPSLRPTLLDLVRGLPARGCTVMLVEHDMAAVADVSDWVICMAQGKIIAEGMPEVIGKNAAVIDAYLGAHHGQPLTKLAPSAASTGTS